MVKTEGPDDHREWRYGWGGQLVSQMVTWTQPQVVAVNISDKDREINSQTKQLRASLPHCLSGHKAELLQCVVQGPTASVSPVGLVRNANSQAHFKPIESESLVVRSRNLF